MTFKRFCLILFITNCCMLNETNGQDDCVPSVQNVSIASNATLWWDLDPNTSCNVTSYQVDIRGDREDTYHFTVTQNFVDVSFLAVCEKWNFTVTPKSNEVTGFAHTVTAYVPLPPDADLSLSYFRFTFSGRSILLKWDLRNQTLGDCSLEYRLTLQDLDRGTIEDVYVEGKSAWLDSASPCVTYEMNLRAINQAHPAIEGPLTTMNLVLGTRAQLRPTLKSIDIQATSINMTWSLEGDANRCPLREFYIDGGTYFNSTVLLHSLPDPTMVSVQIESLRPNSMYYLTASVQNSGGWSPATPIAVQTLDLDTN